jgi:DNA-binding MarR family transcriptional regulator
MVRTKLDPELVYGTWWMITIAQRAMSKARRKELLPFGITNEQAAVLNIVHSIGENATPTEVSRAMIREPNSTASIIYTMERKGMLKTTNDIKRKNVVRVSLTEHGKQMLKKISKRKPMNEIMAILSEEELNQLREIMEKLRDKAITEAEIKFKSVFS